MLKPDQNILDIWEFRRGARMEFLKEHIKEAGRVDKRKLLGYLGICGIHRTTALDYLRDLTDYGLIREEDGEIVWISSEE